jgi:hypothetical protein
MLSIFYTRNLRYRKSKTCWGELGLSFSTAVELDDSGDDRYPCRYVFLFQWNLIENILILVDYLDRNGPKFKNLVETHKTCKDEDLSFGESVSEPSPNVGNTDVGRSRNISITPSSIRGSRPD